MTAVLLVEDDEAISEPLARVIAREGFEVVVASDGRTGLAEALTARFAVVVLDLGLPGLDGLTVCRRVRDAHPAQQVILLTARAEEVDAVRGLDAGADDYVSKPFRVAELMARIRVAARRAGAASLLEASGVRVDLAARRSWSGDTELALTGKEFDLLAVLMGSAGSVVTRAELMKRVWQTTFIGSSRTLDQHVSWLRQKLGDDATHPRFVTTVRGVGFRFEVDER